MFLLYMTTRRNKNTHRRNTYVRVRNKNHYNSKNNNNNKIYVDQSETTLLHSTVNNIPRQYILDDTNNFILKKGKRVLDNVNSQIPYNIYKHRYSNMINAIDIQCIDESSPKSDYYEHNSVKNSVKTSLHKWNNIHNSLTDKYLAISGQNDKFAGWKPVFLAKNNENTQNIQNNIGLSQPSNNAIHNNNNNNNNSINDQSGIIPYKFELSKSFKHWKLSTITQPQKTFYISPKIDNGHMFNPYYNCSPSIQQPTATILTTQKPKKVIHITAEISKINDILILIDKYPLHPDIEYNINMQAIHNIKEPLQKLNHMIGMDIVKSSIIDQILYYIQNFHTLGCSKNDFMHTVIYGPPGTGKTELAKYIGEIFSKLGILKNNIFKKVTRSDLIAGYLGQTASKTRGVIDNCLGGVLFIDEAYSLGNNEKGDSFSKECIDTLCEALSDHKENLMVIIAGYEKELKTCFFDYNQGLESRFTWRFQTSDYSYKELYSIFIKKVLDAKWSISKEDPIQREWFKSNIKHFKFFGRNIETLFAKTKIAHSRRVFCKPKTEKTVLTHLDIIKGFELYKHNDTSNNDKTNFIGAEHMYL